MGFHVGYPWLIYDCICIANTWSRKKGSSRFTGMMGWLGWWATTKKTFEFWYPYGPYGLLDGFRNVSSVSGVKQRNPFGKSSGNTKNLWQSYGNHQLSQIVRMVWSSIPISHLRMKWAKGEALNQSLSCLQTAKKPAAWYSTAFWDCSWELRNIHFDPSNGFQLQNSLVHWMTISWDMLHLAAKNHRYTIQIRGVH